MEAIFAILVGPKSRFSSFLSIFIAIFMSIFKLLKFEYIKNHENGGFSILGDTHGPQILRRGFCKKIWPIF